MNALEVVHTIIEEQNVSLSELVEYTDLGSKSNIYQKLNNTKDLKVGSFVQILEALGYQLVVQNVETDEEIVVDYDE